MNPRALSPEGAMLPRHSDDRNDSEMPSGYSHLMLINSLMSPGMVLVVNGTAARRRTGP